MPSFQRRKVKLKMDSLNAQGVLYVITKAHAMHIAVNLPGDYGYNSTNNFRVWIPHQGKVISTRDVIFDEETFCGKKDLSSNKELIAHMDELVARVSLEPSQAKNEDALEDDGDILSYIPSKPGKILTNQVMAKTTESYSLTKRRI